MKLRNPEALADDLEAGIGEVGWYHELIPKELRLRLPVCGLASLALAYSYEEQGYTVDIIHSKPQLSFDTHESHVFPVVYTDSRVPTVIESTYGAFLRFSGLTPEGILNGQPNLYPDEKIVTFEHGKPDNIVANLALSAFKASRRLEVVSDGIRPPFQDMRMIDMRNLLYEFWNPMNYHAFEPSTSTIAAAKYISGTIHPKNLQFIAE